MTQRTKDSRPSSDRSRHRGQVWSVLGDELVVLDSGGEVVHRLRGDAAVAGQWLLEHPGTSPRELPAHYRPVAQSLLRSGILDDRPGRSRRDVLRLAAAVSAWGVVSMELPHTAAAASGVAATDPPAYGAPTPSQTRRVYDSAIPDVVKLFWADNVSAPFVAPGTSFTWTIVNADSSATGLSGTGTIGGSIIEVDISSLTSDATYVIKYSSGVVTGTSRSFIVA